MQNDRPNVMMDGLGVTSGRWFEEIGRSCVRVGLSGLPISFQTKALITVRIKTIGASPNFHVLDKFTKLGVDNARFEVYRQSQATFEHSN